VGHYYYEVMYYEVMNEHNITVMTSLLGRSGQHAGLAVQVIDLLADPLALVVQEIDDANSEIQLDAYGRPHSQRSRIWTIRLFTDTSPRDLNPIALPWLDNEQIEILLRLITENR